MITPDGKYVADSIGFESTHKIHTELKNGLERTPGIEMKSEAMSDKWISDMKLKPKDVQAEAMEVDHGSIFVKSISGEHDATMSLGFPNYLSNEAQNFLNVAAGVKSNISNMQSAFAALAQNPFAYRTAAEEMLNFQRHDGDSL